MRVGTRITAATSALVAVTLGTYSFLELRDNATERQRQLQREARIIAVSLRSLVEAQGVAKVLENAPHISQAISRSTPGWSVRISPRSLVGTTQTRSSAEPGYISRLRRMLDVPMDELTEIRGNQFVHSLALRVSSIKAPEGYEVAGTLEVSRTTKHLDSAWREDFWQALPVFIIIVIATIIAITILTGGLITRPIAQLLAGIDDVAQGDLSRVLLSERDDEIGRLATRFNEMTASLRESRAETEYQNEAKLQLEHRLSNTEKLATMGQLAAEIAHEVGTPLNVITGRARGLVKKLDDPEAVAKNATIIAEQTGRITRIIQRLIDVTRRKFGSTESEPVNLNQVVITTVEFLGGQFSQAGVETDVNLASDLPMVGGDPDRLQQVVLNLLVNAVQAMPSGGSIRISTEATIRRRPGLEMAPEQQYVCVAIRDTGVGIPEELRAKIFDPFYSSKRHSGGTGLGLAVCHGIVKEHDGWIDIDDPPKEESGTIFRVYLPVT